MKGFYRKIIERCVVIEEVFIKERETKNVKTETIQRITYKAVRLECGHTVKIKDIGREPKHGVKCLDCYFERDDYSIYR